MIIHSIHICFKVALIGLLQIYFEMLIFLDFESFGLISLFQ
jgi:hypothetical protein